MKTYCNPLDLSYRYQHIKDMSGMRAGREGADPTLVYFKERYYLFVSMSAGFWHSEDLLHWTFFAMPDLLIYDYAPDVREVDGYLYFCASRRDKNCPILRTADPLHEPFEEVSAPFPFWDPNLFWDDDGRVYFYWGCSNMEPVYGAELDPKTMTLISSPKPLIYSCENEIGYERPGEDGIVQKESSYLYKQMAPFFNPETQKIEFPHGMTHIGDYSVEEITKMFLAVGKPYMEGAFMTKHGGCYYLQIACPGTEYNIYSDAVYIGHDPLGPFALQNSNPFSSKPGGFVTGAGHGSTIADKYGNYWHASTMRISKNFDFERRVGLFPAGFDKDGVLFCNQNFADYPHKIPQTVFDAASQQPEWMLLSYQKPVTASSGDHPESAVDEDIRTWWSAADAAPGQWLCVDLGAAQDVRAIQVNLADENVIVEFPAESYGDAQHTRHIELETQISHYILEFSLNNKDWHLLENVSRECSNGYYEYENGVTARFIRLTGGHLPYEQPLRVSGLRVFGLGSGDKPAQAEAGAQHISALDGVVRWKMIPEAQGCNVRYGISPDKLYMSRLVYSTNEVLLPTLIKGQDYYVCVDSFNENGITPGIVIKME